MRQFFLTAFVLVPLLSLGQSDSLVSYTEIVTVDSLSKEQLYIRARQWINDAFKDSRFVYRIADKETGELVGSGQILSAFKTRFMKKEGIGPIRLDFTFGIYVKDGKYKYEFTNFKGNEDAPINSVLTTSSISPETIPMTKKGRSDEVWNSIKYELDRRMVLVIASLKESMGAKSIKTDF